MTDDKFANVPNFSGDPQRPPELTLRDYFAAKAMQGLCSSAPIEIRKVTPDGILILPARTAIPTLAYEYADAMLKARGA